MEVHDVSGGYFTIIRDLAGVAGALFACEAPTGLDFLELQSDGWLAMVSEMHDGGGRANMPQRVKDPATGLEGDSIFPISARVQRCQVSVRA